MRRADREEPARVARICGGKMKIWETERKEETHTRRYPCYGEEYRIEEENEEGGGKKSSWGCC